MKVSFTLGPGQDIRINNIASRILTENLSRNSNFDVTFLNYTITSSLNLHKKVPEYIEKMEKKHKVLKECFTSWYNLFKVSYSNYHYVDLLLNELKTEYLFYSCSLLQLEFYQVAQILNKGVKLIIGGPLMNTYSFKEARDIISKLVDDQKWMSNLLIIKGYVDLTTNLYKIVQKWEDFEITENDFSTFWECTEDYTVDKITRLKKFKALDLGFLENYYPSKYSVFILDNKCWWGKCRFCIYPFFKHIDFTGGESVNKITDNILRTIRRHGNNSVFFANDYFQFTPTYKEIMENLINEGVDIVIFTGVQSLQDKKFIDNVNRYVSSVKLGLESFSDFSLKYINKGYTYDDIKNMLRMIKSYMKKDVFFLTNIIVDLPINNKEEILRNYERAWDFKKEIMDAGFRFNYSSKLLTVGNDTREQFIDNKFITISDKNISGRHLLFKYFREMDIIKDDLYKDMALPLLRFDENGNELSTDFDYIPYDLALKDFRWIE